MDKITNYTLIRDYVSSHSRTSEDNLILTSRSFVKLCNAAIACYRFTGSLGNLATAFDRLVTLIKDEKDSEGLKDINRD